MDATPPSRLPAFWRRLTLWPRLAIAVTVGFLVLFAGFSVLGIRAVDASTNRILHERLAITEELAEDFDGMLQHRFGDLGAFDSRPTSPAVRRRLLVEIFRASSGDFTTLTLLDARSRVVDSLGAGAPRPGTSVLGTHYPARATAGRPHGVSAPFRDARGRAVVALSVPVRGGGALVGTFDLASPDVMERLDAARSLGTTGHAELVGPGGIALASTEPGEALQPGEHLALYREMLRRSKPGIADVPVTPNRKEPGTMARERHVMAFVRLTAAPWGVALGGTDSETYAPARHLRRTLMLAGGGALAALWLLTLIGAQLLVRPVRRLTRAAEEMAAGDLDRTIAVSEGGEIGTLAESLETMRAQLKESLETVRRWGEELEVKVDERTAALNARNRQLAAVSAIMTVAGETHDLTTLLERCLDVVLEQTRMEAAAIRLDRAEDGSTEVVARGAWDSFTCKTCSERFCDLATAGGRPLYLAPGAEERVHPDCAFGSDALAVLPLRGPSGLVGVLTVGSRDGVLPTEEERPILAAISDQIAVAVENGRLADELRRLEARHQVQRMRSELISAVSHELRTPLGFIKGYATTLLRDDAPIDDATRRHFLEIIDEETVKLEHMIDELLDASRLQAGRLPIDPRPVALGELLASVVDKARPTLEANGHTVSLTGAVDGVVVLADPLRIEQVLDNLLENASRYAAPDTPVEVAALVEGGRAVVSVTDRGGGIAVDELEQIFEPFYRGRNASQSGIRGAGLGLAISRGIVEAHGGTIWAESNGDAATSFVLTLPVATAAEAQRVAADMPLV